MSIFKQRQLSERKDICILHHIIICMNLWWFSFSGVEYGKDGEALVLKCSGATSSNLVTWNKVGPPDKPIATSSFGVNPDYPHISWSYDLTAGFSQITIDPLIAAYTGEYRCTWTKGTENQETTYDVELAGEKT